MAFDTIDHDILFNSFRDWFGVNGTVLRWIKSYLSNRKQKVKLGNSFFQTRSHSHMVCPRDLSWAPSILPSTLPLNSISPTDTVKNLGVIFDSGNTFTNHITKMCRACYYHLKHLRCIRKFLSVETAALLANSMISSRLDYCNSLLYGISKYNVAKLQKIQNALCRIVFSLDRMSHVTPFLRKLHWLPITYCILFKYNLITFKAINFSQPIYLSSLIKQVV